MKRIFKVLIFSVASFAGGFAGEVSAQKTDDSIRKKPQGPLVRMSFSVNASSGSNGLNQYVLNRLAFGGYMSPAELEHAESMVKDNNRTGFVLGSNLNLPFSFRPDTVKRRDWRFKATGISIAQLSAAGIMYTKDAYRLVFRGNEPFLGQKLNLGPSGMQQFAVRTVSVNFADVYRRKMADQDTRFGFSLGLGQVTAYRNLKITEGWLYTDSNRNYIDAQYDGSFYNAGRNTGAGVGYGLNSDLYLRWGKSGSNYLLQISNLGLFYIPDGDDLSKDMNGPVRINQSTVGIKNLNTDSWLEDLRDTINGGLAPDSAKASKWVVSPFTVAMSLYTSKWVLKADYMNIRGYIPRISMAPLKPLFKIKKFRFTPELQLGGFDNYNVNLGVNYNIIDPESKKKQWVFQLKFQGLEGMALPRYDHGAGAFFSLQYLMF